MCFRICCTAFARKSKQQNKNKWNRNANELNVTFTKKENEKQTTEDANIEKAQKKLNRQRSVTIVNNNNNEDKKKWAGSDRQIPDKW